jgi:hypothetical protein
MFFSLTTVVMLCCFSKATVSMCVSLTATHISQHYKGNILLHFCVNAGSIYVVDDVHKHNIVNILCTLPVVFILEQNLNQFITSGIFIMW